MTILLFIYNNLMSIVFAVLSFAFFLIYFRTRDKISLWFGILFLVYIFDTSFYAFAEILDVSGHKLSNITLWLTVCTSIMAIVSRWSCRMLIYYALNFGLRKWEYAVYAAHAVVSLICNISLAVAPDAATNIIDFIFSVAFNLVYLSVAMRANRLACEKKLRWFLGAVFVSWSALVVSANVYEHFVVPDNQVFRRNPFVEGIGILIAAIAIIYFAAYRKRIITPSLDEEQLMKLFSDKYGLTLKERELLPLLLAGENNQSISEKSYISISTVKVHLHNIYQKLGVERRGQVAGRYTEFCRQYRK